MRSPMFFLVILYAVTTHAQDKSLPYYEIPVEPENFSAGTVAARIIDGLGFRYYWSTEGLRPEDLAYKPGPEARSSEETLEHIFELSQIIVNSVKKLQNVSQRDAAELSFSEMRRKTLENLKTSSDILKKATDSEMQEFKIVFVRDSGTRELPFWNQLNGPIADALWHVGQVVSFRRSSGNPFSDKVNVLTGKVVQ
jgi:hypothetical protein